MNHNPSVRAPSSMRIRGTRKSTGQSEVSLWSSWIDSSGRCVANISTKFVRSIQRTVRGGWWACTGWLRLMQDHRLSLGLSAIWLGEGGCHRAIVVSHRVSLSVTNTVKKTRPYRYPYHYTLQLNFFVLPSKMQPYCLCPWVGYFDNKLLTCRYRLQESELGSLLLSNQFTVSHCHCIPAHGLNLPQLEGWAAEKVKNGAYLLKTFSIKT